MCVCVCVCVCMCGQVSLELFRAAALGRQHLRGGVIHAGLEAVKARECVVGGKLMGYVPPELTKKKGEKGVFCDPERDLRIRGRSIRVAGNAKTYSNREVV